MDELAVTSAEMATAEADWAWLRPGESDEVARWRDAVSRWDALCFPYPAAHARWRLSNRRIAKSLFITEKTVSVHVTHILEKLQVTNRSEAGALARGPRQSPAEGEVTPAGTPSAPSAS
jgi:Bacterial regulatory proteins, luxR family